MSDFLSKALQVVERGWPVFPVRPDKVPLCEHGYKDATTDMDKIEGWARRFSRANVAVPTGGRTGIAVLDVDGPDGEFSLAKLSAERGVRFPDTLQAKSGRGRHLYFKHRRGLKSSAGKLGKGLDIRAEGASIVVPPSVHPSGATYTWANDLPIAPFPLAAYYVLNEPAPKPVPVVPRGADLSRLCEIARSAPEGQRNVTLNRVAYTAGGMVASGRVALDEAQKALVSAGCAIGLELKECVVTVRSGLRTGMQSPL